MKTSVFNRPFLYRSSGLRKGNSPGMGGFSPIVVPKMTSTFGARIRRYSSLLAIILLAVALGTLIASAVASDSHELPLSSRGLPPLSMKVNDPIAVLNANYRADLFSISYLGASGVALFLVLFYQKLKLELYQSVVRRQLFKL